jgi:hypothetical protein
LAIALAIDAIGVSRVGRYLGKNKAVAVTGGLSSLVNPLEPE